MGLSRTRLVSASHEITLTADNPPVCKQVEGIYKASCSQPRVVTFNLSSNKANSSIHNHLHLNLFDHHHKSHPEPPLPNIPTMKLTLLAILAATASVQADQLLSCGYHLVNRGGQPSLPLPLRPPQSPPGITS